MSDQTPDDAPASASAAESTADDPIAIDLDRGTHLIWDMRHTGQFWAICTCSIDPEFEPLLEQQLLRAQMNPVRRDYVFRCGGWVGSGRIANRRIVGLSVAYTINFTSLIRRKS